MKFLLFKAQATKLFFFWRNGGVRMFGFGIDCSISFVSWCFWVWDYFR